MVKLVGSNDVGDMPQGLNAARRDRELDRGMDEQRSVAQIHDGGAQLVGEAQEPDGGALEGPDSRIYLPQSLDGLSSCGAAQRTRRSAAPHRPPTVARASKVDATGYQTPEQRFHAAWTMLRFKLEARRPTP